MGAWVLTIVAVASVAYWVGGIPPRIDHKKRADDCERKNAQQVKDHASAMAAKDAELLAKEAERNTLTGEVKKLEQELRAFEKAHQIVGK